MKKLFFTFFLILIAVGVGFLVHKDPGYVLIAFGGWTLETSFWVALVSWFLIFIVLYFLIRLIHNTLDLGERWYKWRKRRRHFKMDEKIELGVYDGFAGEWASAEKNFTKASKLNDGKVLAYLGAAFCANQEGEFARAQEYLDEALKADPQCETPVLFARARWLVQRGDWESAKLPILQLKEKAPKNKLVVELSRRLDFYLFLQELKNSNGEELEMLWRSLPREHQRDPQFLVAYIETSLQHHHHAEVVDLIEHVLKKEWHPELLKYYSQANVNRRQQLLMAEKWLKKHSEDPDLLLCVAKLNEKNF